MHPRNTRINVVSARNTFNAESALSFLSRIPWKGEPWVNPHSGSHCRESVTGTEENGPWEIGERSTD